MCFRVKTTLRCVLAAALFSSILSSPAPAAGAQLCSKYGLEIKVTDEAGDAVEGVEVRFRPKLTGKHRKLVRDPDDAKVFNVVLLEGDKVRGAYELSVRAPGYAEFTRGVTFPHCKRNKLEVRLARRTPGD